MAMKTIFDERNIRLQAAFSNKEEAIRAAGQILVDNAYVDADYIDDMLAREKAVSTYIGNSVAIPHGLSESKNRIENSGISFVQVPQGVEFEGGVARLIIGIAGKNNEHLEILGKIAMVCTEEDNIEKLVQAQTKQEILSIFKELA